MPEILSQEEIDALLGASPAGDSPAAVETTIDGRTPVAYDFKHPNRVSKDQIRTLENIHNNFAGHLGSALSGLLRTVVDVDLVSVDQFTYSEFVMSLAWPSCTYKIRLDPLEGLCLLDVSPVLAFSFIDRMFGGHGRPLEMERELSGIERNLMDIITNRALKELSHGWQRIKDVTATIEGFESTPQFLQIVPPGETVIVTTFQVKILSKSGIVTVCYPYLTLEPVMEDLSGQNWINAAEGQSNEEAYAILEAGVRAVSANISVELARSNISLRDFLRAKVGDVIIADTRVSEPTRIMVEGREKFIGRPGLRGSHRAVEIIAEIAAEV